MTSLLVRPLPASRAHSNRQPIRVRRISNSHASRTAIPFFLNNPSHGSQPSPSQKSQQPILRMIMFGKPGAGKGTLSARLTSKYDIVSLSTGDLLRAHIAERTTVGKLAEGIMKKGELLPDEVVLDVVSGKLDLLKNKHWILDGFPRTLIQGKLLDARLRAQNLPLSLVVNIDVPDQVILDRIGDRFVHLPSGRVYNLKYSKPKVDGLDDVTGEALTKRPDDNADVFANRLKQFYQSTSPLLSYYSNSGTPLYTLRGSTSDEIWPQLDTVLKGSFPSLREREESRDERRRHRVSDALFADEESAVVKDGVGRKQ